MTDARLTDLANCQRDLTHAALRTITELRTNLAKETALLDHLSELLKACPGVVIQFNDDPDMDDAMGMVPVGFSIRTDGCHGVRTAVGPDLRTAILNDKAEVFVCALCHKNRIDPEEGDICADCK